MDKHVVIHLGCPISKVAPESFGGTEIILLCEPEVNQHGDVFVREQNVRRSGEKFSAAEHSRCDRTHLMSLCTTPRMWRNSTPLRSDLNQTLAMDSPTSTGTRRGRKGLVAEM